MKSYRGRFAPSPSGPLHFGSLIAAVASYVDARAAGGIWLVRMEDIDPPREQPGAADSILATLEAHSLFWDEPVLYQSSRLEGYHQALSQLTTFVYPCSCIRQRLAQLDGHYDGHCLRTPPDIHNDECALRIQVDGLDSTQLETVEAFEDLFLGPQAFPVKPQGDFIVLRKDGLFSYQLAVAVDDAFQQITHIIRGRDLLALTSRQRYLLKLLGCDRLPDYGHLPLALGSDSEKLSKQTGALPVDDRQAPKNLMAALTFLGLAPPEDLSQDCELILSWASDHWQRHLITTESKQYPC